jgi:hypothetical protein
MLLSLSSAAIIILLSSHAFAGLGGDENSVQKDTQSLGGTRTVSEHGRYRLHHISKGLSNVNEYEGQDGKVFALTWSGKKHPDLQNILGSHLIDFQSALAEARKTHHHGGALSVTTGNIHVEMGGHAGAVYGQTWLTDQVPAGMDVHDIK